MAAVCRVFGDTDDEEATFFSDQHWASYQIDSNYDIQSRSAPGNQLDAANAKIEANVKPLRSMWVNDATRSPANDPIL